MSSFVNTLKAMYRFWPVQLFVHSLRIAYLRYVHYPLHRHKYRDVQQFKDRHKGERCFIIATGPSLTLEDLNRLKGEICFGMNSIYKFFEHTDWRPTYYSIFDETMYQRVKMEIDQVSFNCVFTPDFLPWNTENMYKLPCIPNRCITAEERKHCKRWTIEKMSEDISKCVYSGTSVVYFIMQICFYMGFKEIYLVGADCSNFGHHSTIARYSGEDKISGSQSETTIGIMKDYQIAKREGDKRGVNIFNATRGGKLEIYPRVSLDNLPFLK